MTRTFPLALLCLLLPACQSYYPVRVQVLDAETHQPIPRATVEADYMTELTATDVYTELIFHHTAGPKPTTATTDAGGVAVLPLSDFRARYRGAQARADGYLPSQTFIDPARFDQLRHEHRSDTAAETGPPDLILELYRGPHPTLRLVLPDGYRGLLRLDSAAPTAVLALAPGQRVAEISVQTPALQKLPRVTLGQRHGVQSWQYTARYANGTPLPNDRQHPPDEAVALRFVSGYNFHDIFMIGTAPDRQAARAQIRDFPADFDKLWNGTEHPAN